MNIIALFYSSNLSYVLDLFSYKNTFLSTIIFSLQVIFFGVLNVFNKRD